MKIDVIFQAIDKVAQPLRNIDRSVQSLSSAFDKMQNKMIGINQSIEAFDRMGQAIDQITAPYREFEQSMAELSSITGIAGADLGRLGEVARRTGVDSGLGAKGAANAFALLASQIDVSKIGLDGLIGLQQETITLAQAAGMSMDESANAMAGTINQFGLQATEANRVINVLAAGSKYGAASIPDLAQSFKVVGAAANAAGLSIEDTAGIIEVLSKNNLKGAEAGTAMRNIMLKMQTVLGVDFSKVTFAQALEQLKPKMKDASYMAKVFGMENMAAAQFLIANADAVDEMTSRVTDTNVAAEQAAINTNTWNFALDVQAARMNDWLMSITENNKAFFGLIQTGSNFMRMAMSFAPLFQALKFGITGAVTLCKGLVSVVGKVATSSRVAAAGLWIKNAAITAGNGILAAYNWLVNASSWAMMRQSIATKASAVWTAVCSAAQTVASTVADLWAKRTLLLTAVQGGLSKALRVARTVMLTGVLPALGGVIASTWAWTAALLANPITWIVVGIMALIAAIAWCWNSFEGFRAVILTIWDTIVGFGEAVWNFVVAPFEAAWEFLKGIGNAIGTLFGGGSLEEAGGELAAGFNNGVDAGVSRYKKGVNGVVNTASSIDENYDIRLKQETVKQQQKEQSKASASNSIDIPTIEMPTTTPAFGMPTIDTPPAMPALDMPNLQTMNMPTASNSYATQNATTAANVDIKYSPTINISGDMSQKSREDFLSLLRSNAAEMARMIKEETRKQERANYGVPQIG